MTGLYLHIPFCQEKCEYCDFYSITQLEQINDFVDALCIELQLRSDKLNDYTFDTVFWGGGTPSLLTADQFSQIWGTIRQHYTISEDAEITIEANPGTISAEQLVEIRAAGFNRLSMGVQSFHPAELSFLGRIHTVGEVVENFEHARLAGFDNINLDLMTAFPGITPASFRKSLEQAIELGPEHISCYTLIFEPETILYKRMLRGEVQPVEEEQEAEYYQLAQELLARHGYEQYEISNFARGQERRCKHNLVYWRHMPYAGFGPSAHSFINQSRFANKRSVLAYNKLLAKGELPIDFTEGLTGEQLISEYTFLGLRLREGINLAAFQDRFGQSFADHFGGTYPSLVDGEMLEEIDGHIRLTEKGWMVADTVAAAL